MQGPAELARVARECLGAAELLAERYPVQSMEMMARSVEAAMRACCASEGICFENGEDPVLMARFVPEEAWDGASRLKVERLMASCVAWARSGRTDGDFRKALEADMETAVAFLCGVDCYLDGRRMLPAAAA